MTRLGNLATTDGEAMQAIVAILDLMDAMLAAGQRQQELQARFAESQAD